MNKAITQFGLIYGGCLVLGFYLSYLILGSEPENYTKGEIVGYSVMILSSITIYFALRQYKTERVGQPLSFWRGFGLGAGVSFIGGLIFALYNVFYINYLHPEFIDEYIAYSAQNILSSGTDAQQVQQQLAELQDYARLMESDAFYAFVMFMTVFVIGLLFSLVTAIATKD